MKNSHVIFLLNEKVRAVKVLYDPDDHHTKAMLFKTLDPNIDVGDLVVVQSSTRHKFTIAQVHEVDVTVDFDLEGEIRWVSQTLDLGAFEALDAAEKEAIQAVQDSEAKRKRNELRQQIFGGDEAVVSSLSITDLSDGTGQGGDLIEPPSAPTGEEEKE